MRNALFGASVAAFLAGMLPASKPAQALTLPAAAGLNAAADALSVTENVFYGWGYRRPYYGYGYRPWRPYYGYGYSRPWRPYYGYRGWRPYYSYYRPWRPYYSFYRPYYRSYWFGPGVYWGGPRLYRAYWGPRYWGGYRPYWGGGWGWRGGFYRTWY